MHKTTCLYCTVVFETPYAIASWKQCKTQKVLKEVTSQAEHLIATFYVTNRCTCFIYR